MLGFQPLNIYCNNVLTWDSVVLGTTTQRKCCGGMLLASTKITTKHITLYTKTFSLTVFAWTLQSFNQSLKIVLSRRVLLKPNNISKARLLCSFWCQCSHSIEVTQMNSYIPTTTKKTKHIFFFFLLVLMLLCVLWINQKFVSQTMYNGVKTSSRTRQVGHPLGVR